MTNYAFTLLVRGLDLDDADQLERLGMLHYDLVAASIEGRLEVDVEIDAATPVDAILQVDADLRALGITVASIDLDLVNVPEIAIRAGVSRETVRLWTRGLRRAGFPLHAASGGSTLLWRWSDIFTWLGDIDALADEPTPLPADDVDYLNGLYSQLRARRDEGWMRPSTQPVASFALHRANRRPRPKSWRPATRVAVVEERTA